MQTLSALLPLAQTATARPEPLVQESWAQLVAIGGPLALYFGALLLAQIVVFWIASKIVANDESRFTNALKVFGLYLLLNVVLGVAAGVATPIGAALLNMLTGGGGASIGLLFILVALVVFGLGLFFTFLIPMRVYEISVGRAFGFLLISLILSAGATFGLNFAFRTHVKQWNEAMYQLAKAPTADRRSFVRELNRQAQNSALTIAENLASDPNLSFQERQASLTTMFNQLEAMRVALVPGDRTGIAHYEERKARYEKLLRELREDVQAKQTSGTP